MLGKHGVELFSPPWKEIPSRGPDPIHLPTKHELSCNKSHPRIIMTHEIFHGCWMLLTHWEKNNVEKTTAHPYPSGFVATWRMDPWVPRSNWCDWRWWKMTRPWRRRGHLLQARKWGWQLGTWWTWLKILMLREIYDLWIFMRVYNSLQLYNQTRTFYLDWFRRGSYFNWQHSQ